MSMYFQKKLKVVYYYISEFSWQTPLKVTLAIQHFVEIHNNTGKLTTNFTIVNKVIVG